MTAPRLEDMVIPRLAHTAVQRPDDMAAPRLEDMAIPRL
eukprot:gene25136-30671_t